MLTENGDEPVLYRWGEIRHNLVPMQAIFSWSRRIKQNLKHSIWTGSSSEYAPESRKSLKNFIHQSVSLFLRKDHQASILWLDTDLPYIKLFSPHNASFPSRLKNRCISQTCTFSVPRSPRIIHGTPPTWPTQSIKYRPIILGFLLLMPTSKQRIRLLKPSIAPWILNP